MKKQIMIFVAGLAVAGFFSFKAYDISQRTAEVEQMEGLYVFTDCKPVGPYDYLGTEKMSMTMGSAQYGAVRDKLIKKVKKEHPRANGIILKFTDGGTDQADAIYLK